MGDKEIEMTKGISNETVCNYFFAFFILASILAGLALISDVVAASNMRGGYGISLVVRSVLVFGLAVANSLFLYVMCARSLLK